MADYPTSPAFSYPVTRSLEFKTLIFRGTDGTEQRCPMLPGAESWTLPYPRLTLEQRDLLFGFFEARKGTAAQDISFTFEGVTYSGLYLDSDTMSALESEQQARSLTVTLRQIVRTPDAGALPSDFPTLSSGSRVQFPYTHSRSFDTVISSTDGGRFTRSNRASSLRTWTAGGPVLSDSEAQAIWDMFSRAGGRWKTFGFTDPDSGTRYATCRFAEDRIEWRYDAKGINSVQVKLQQVP